MTSSPSGLHGLLRAVTAVLRQHRIWYCLFYGTLLGAVRAGDLIEWDQDVDLLIRPADVPRLLALDAELERHGLQVGVHRYTGSWLALNPGRVPCFDAGLLRVVRDGAHCDLWAPTLFADGVLRQHDLDTEVCLYPETAFPAFFVELLGSAMVRGDTHPVPRHSDRLLSLLYGLDWRVPRRSAMDGGAPRKGRTSHGAVAEPELAHHAAWCVAQGWDRSRYVGQPAWPRTLRGAGPRDPSERTASTSGSTWWHTLAEIGARP
jgi:hypothetical protein